MLPSHRPAVDENCVNLSLAGLETLKQRQLSSSPRLCGRSLAMRTINRPVKSRHAREKNSTAGAQQCGLRQLLTHVRKKDEKTIEVRLGLQCCTSYLGFSKTLLCCARHLSQRVSHLRAIPPSRHSEKQTDTQGKACATPERTGLHNRANNFYEVLQVPILQQQFSNASSTSGKRCGKQQRWDTRTPDHNRRTLSTIRILLVWSSNRKSACRACPYVPQILERSPGFLQKLLRFGSNSRFPRLN